MCSVYHWLQCFEYLHGRKSVHNVSDSYPRRLSKVFTHFVGKETVVSKQYLLRCDVLQTHTSGRKEDVKEERNIVAGIVVPQYY